MIKYLRADTSLTWVYFNLLQVPVEDLRSPFHIWFGYRHLHVETARADQGTDKGRQVRETPKQNGKKKREGEKLPTSSMCAVD